jgi:hypothetical protein
MPIKRRISEQSKRRMRSTIKRQPTKKDKTIMKSMLKGVKKYT